MAENTAVAVQEVKTAAVSRELVNSPFSSPECFEVSQRMAKCLAASSMIPDTFHQNIPNCMIALELSARYGYSPFLVMQNLYVIHGRPGFSSQFIIAAIQSCGRYSALHYRWTTDKAGKKVGCRAEATELATGEILTGSEVTLEMAQKEGWSTKNGSKWQSMPEQMMMYRAAAFFGRLYAPDVLLGMNTTDELSDIYGTGNNRIKAEIVPERKSSATDELNAMIKEAEKYEAEDLREEEVAPEIETDTPELELKADEIPTKEKSRSGK